MMIDMGQELRATNVYAFSLWPGPVRTETMETAMKNDKTGKLACIFKNGESTQSPGRVLAKIVSKLDDSKFMKSKITGRILFTSEVAAYFGIKDVDSRVIPHMLSLKTIF